MLFPTKSKRTFVHDDNTIFTPQPSTKSHAQHNPSAKSQVSQQMSEREIVAQSMTFLLAGYETTSAVLAFLSRVLAENPVVQQRLHDEIEGLGKEVNYETLSNLPYFDQVFDEVCRLFPTASQ